MDGWQRGESIVPQVKISESRKVGEEVQRKLIDLIVLWKFEISEILMVIWGRFKFIIIMLMLTCRQSI